MKNPFEKASEDPERYALQRPASSEEIVDMAIKLMDKRFRRCAPLASPDMTRQYLKLQLATLEYEVFCVLFLDNRHRVISFEQLFRGTIDGASVYPREVVKLALALNAAACILVHNHPSGIAEPSPADRAITQRVREALGLVDVRVLDHFVIGGSEFVSFAERGLL